MTCSRASAACCSFMPIVTLRVAERARLARLFQRPREKRRAEDVAWVLSLMAARDSVNYARRYAHALAGAALTPV